MAKPAANKATLSKAKTSRDPDLSVVTITYNERESIRDLLNTINALFQRHNVNGEVIVVDDSSPDGTAEVVLELKKKYPNTILLQRPAKMGVGSAYRDGLARARGQVVIPLDADLSHSPKVIPELYALAKEGKIGWGSRYLGDTCFETDFPHKVGTYLLNLWVRTILQTAVRDNTMGYFAMKKELLERILTYGQERKIYPFERILYGVPIAVLARHLNLPIVEVKTNYYRRKYGQTKIPFWRGLQTVLTDMAYALQLRSQLPLLSSSPHG